MDNIKNSNKVQLLSNKNEALSRFYDAAANAPAGYNFFSPVALNYWSTELAEWLCEGKKVCEIGPGKGALAIKVSEICSKPMQYYMVDISQAMLDMVKAELDKQDKTPIQFHYSKGDIESKIPAGIDPQSIDRIAAINVLQDIDIWQALNNMRTMLRPGGMLRATLISKEAQDRFWTHDIDYDTQDGIWYASSCFHEECCTEPMGFREISGKKIPFYRMMKCYTREELDIMFRQCGFEVQSIEVIIYPVEYVLARWSSKYHYMNLSEKQKKLLTEWQGYPDGWSVVASRGNK